MTGRVKLGAPLAGWLGDLSEVPDPVFAERMMGDGFAIDPVEGVLAAPCAGTVILVAPTGHSATLRTEAGAEILMHVGLETVALNGRGFEVHVEAGQRVEAGETLISFDLESVLAGARSLVTPIVLANGDRFELIGDTAGRRVAIGDHIGEIRPLGGARTDSVLSSTEESRTLQLPLANGIHARPAARIAAAARSFAADIRIAANGREANARSPIAVMTLGARFGDEIEIAATGSDAAGAVAAIEALIVRTLPGSEEDAAPAAEPAPLPAPRAAGGAPDADGLSGVCAVPGIAIGQALRLDARDRDIAEEGAGVEQERAALSAAIERVSRRLAGMAATRGAGSGIAAAHAELLLDEELRASADALVTEGKAAAFAWRAALRRCSGALRATGSTLLEQRIEDLLDLERQVIAELAGDAAAPEDALPENAILVAQDILPSQLMAIDLGRIAGICTGGGGPTSHVAIMAAAAAVPMLVALGPQLEAVSDGASLLMDAQAGLLLVDPPEAAVASARDTMTASRRRRAADMAAALEECRTRDGVRIEMFANLASAAEAERAVAAGAEGCGLLRTEFLFLDRTDPPGAAEQLAAYQAIADALGSRPLIVRTLDIGGDKPVPYLPMPHEENPALGLRGVRASLWRADLLDEQLRAILSVRPAGRCRIMVPMVASIGELQAVRERLEAIAAELGVEPRPELGIMIETPAAAMLADRLAESADFFSIGSNDLTQYVLAMDRGNPLVAAQVDAFHPAVLRAIALAAEGARRHGRPLGVCGGLASDPLGALLLIGLGATELSATCASIPAVKAQIRRVTLEECRTLAAACLDADSPEAVRALASERLNGGDEQEERR